MNTPLNELLTVAIFAAQGEANARMSVIAARIDGICTAHDVEATQAGVDALPPKAQKRARELIAQYAEWRTTSEKVQKLLDGLRAQ